MSEPFKYIDSRIDLILPVEFHSTLVKWGNSVGLALPKPIRDGMKLKAGDSIKIIVQDNKICLEKENLRVKVSD
jgi:AbrB family looped-hinge helix DNA binding protein